MADLTQQQVYNAILSAIKEHDADIGKRPNAGIKLQKEANSLITKIYEANQSDKENRKKEIKNINDLLKKKLNTAEETKQKKSDAKEGKGILGSFSAGMNKIVRGADKAFTALSNNMFVKMGITANTLMTNASYTLMDSLRTINVSGVAQNYDDLRKSIVNGVISLDTLTAQATQYSKTFAILNRQTGNGAQAFMDLTNQAAEFAKTNNINATGDQLARFVSSYTEAQRRTAGLDRLNAQQQQQGAQRFMLAVDKMAYYYGVNRDKIVEGAASIDDSLRMKLIMSGRTEDANILGSLIETMKQQGRSIEEINDVQQSIASGTWKEGFATTMSLGGAMDIGTQMLQMSQSGREIEALQLYMAKETSERMMNHLRATQGANAPTTMVHTDMREPLTRIMNAYTIGKGIGQERPTGTVLNTQDALNNARQKHDNNMIALLARSETGMNAFLNAQTKMVEAMNKATTSLINIDMKMGGGTWAQWLGAIGGVVSALGGLSNLFLAWKGIQGFGGVVAKATKAGTAIAKTSGLLSGVAKYAVTGTKAVVAAKLAAGAASFYGGMELGKALGLDNVGASIGDWVGGLFSSGSEKRRKEIEANIAKIRAENAEKLNLKKSETIDVAGDIKQKEKEIVAEKQKALDTAKEKEEAKSRTDSSSKTDTQKELENTTNNTVQNQYLSNLVGLTSDLLSEVKSLNYNMENQVSNI